MSGRIINLSHSCDIKKWAELVFRNWCLEGRLLSSAQRTLNDAKKDAVWQRPISNSTNIKILKDSFNTTVSTRFMLLKVLYPKNPHWLASNKFVGGLTNIEKVTLQEIFSFISIFSRFANNFVSLSLLFCGPRN